MLFDYEICLTEFRKKFHNVPKRSKRLYLVFRELSNYVYVSTN